MNSVMIKDGLVIYNLAYALLLGWISWEDLRHREIPVVGLGMVAFLGFLEGWQSSYFELEVQALVATLVWLALVGLTHMVGRFKKRQSLGQGDIWLISLLVMALPCMEVPYFVLGIGIMGYVWGIGWKAWTDQERFPMVPAISMAFEVVRIFL